MIRTYCDRDGTLVTAEAFSMVWFNGKEQMTSVLCRSCHDSLIAWFGDGAPPEAVPIDVTVLQSTAVKNMSPPVIG